MLGHQGGHDEYSTREGVHPFHTGLYDERQGIVRAISGNGPRILCRQAQWTVCIRGGDTGSGGKHANDEGQDCCPPSTLGQEKP